MTYLPSTVLGLLLVTMAILGLVTIRLAAKSRRQALAIEQLTEALTISGATPVESEALTHLRILEGTPLYGTDIRDKELPQETEQTRALHFAKGCYLGQEIVERIRSRGNVHRTFVGLRLNGELPVAGSKLQTDSKEIGELTSVTSIPLSGTAQIIQLALGYVRREALDRASPLLYPGGTAIPIALPFSSAETT